MTSQIIPADPDNARTLARCANDIRSLRKRVSSDIVEIGRMLIESKKLAGHGNWLSWLEREFQWTDDTALNYMRVYELVKSRNFRDLSNIPISGLFLLGAPSTPEGAKQEATSRAEAGEPIPLNTVKEIVKRAKQDERAAAYETMLEDRRNREPRALEARGSKNIVAEPGKVGADSSRLARLKQAWSKATVLEQERFQVWLSREGSPRADPIATMRKALITWFREHMPDTPDIRVKVSHSENVPHVAISWRYCEGQCHLMLTAPVVEKAIRVCGRAAGYKDTSYSYRMRQPRIGISERSDDETESSRTICAPES
jgi:hypothetical protein